MKTALEQMALHTLHHAEGRKADKAFHAALLAGTANPFLVSLTNGVTAAVEALTQYKLRLAKVERDPVPDHRRVYEAVAAQEGDAAREAMNRLIRLAIQDMPASQRPRRLSTASLPGVAICSPHRHREPLSMKNHLLRFLALLLGFVTLAQAGDKYTFVVVHGATAGSWEWKSTGKFLTDDGHTVYRATLTGLGERMHLNSPDIDLETHINDVVNLILFEDLHDVVLTGHSYGGMVITGVMDRVPERIKHVVYSRRRRARRWHVAL